MRSMTRMRDLLTPWLVVAVSVVAFLPLILSGGCEIACELGAMPTGACGHTSMGAVDTHLASEMLASAPLVQPSLAAVALLMLLLALMSVGARSTSLPITVEMPSEDRAGTRLRV